jgi:hypothetical protein
MDNYHDQNSIPDLALPTNDFKEISLAGEISDE